MKYFDPLTNSLIILISETIFYTKNSVVKWFPGVPGSLEKTIELPAGISR